MLTVPPETASGSELPGDGPPNAIIGVPAKPGWVVPSMSTEVVIEGRGEPSAIVWTPVPGMAKSIVLVPPVCALESRIAWRSEPGPLSAVVVTTKTPSVKTELRLQRRRAIRVGIHAERGVAVEPGGG